jgi:hypothetical protein
MKSLILFLRIGAVYLAAWFVSYVFYVGADFQFVADYWIFFWTGGGELPTFIQLTSWLLTLAAISAWVVVRSLLRRKSRDTGKAPRIQRDRCDDATPHDLNKP